MLQIEPSARYTVEQVLNDPWMRQMTVEKAKIQKDLPSDVLDNMRKFNAKRKLKAAAMAVMVGARLGIKKRLMDMVEKSPATNFNLEQLSKLRDAFKRYSSMEGRITRDGFAKALEDLGFTKTLPVDSLFRLFDTGGEGAISYRAFLTHFSTLKNDSEASIKFCFDVYDENGDGSLSKDEVSSVLRNLMNVDHIYNLGDETTQEENIQNQIEEIFARLDKDGNGMIDFEEFKAGISKERILIDYFVAPIRNLS